MNCGPVISAGATLINGAGFFSCRRIRINKIKIGVKQLPDGFQAQD